MSRKSKRQDAVQRFERCLLEDVLRDEAIMRMLQPTLSAYERYLLRHVVHRLVKAWRGDYQARPFRIWFVSASDIYCPQLDEDFRRASAFAGLIGKAVDIHRFVWMTSGSDPWQALRQELLLSGIRRYSDAHFCSDVDDQCPCVAIPDDLLTLLLICGTIPVSNPRHWDTRPEVGQIKLEKWLHEQLRYKRKVA